jgi:hypothetical protein
MRRGRRCPQVLTSPPSVTARPRSGPFDFAQGRRGNPAANVAPASTVTAQQLTADGPPAGATAGTKVWVNTNPVSITVRELSITVTPNPVSSCPKQRRGLREIARLTDTRAADAGCWKKASRYAAGPDRYVQFTKSMLARLSMMSTTPVWLVGWKVSKPFTTSTPTPTP